MPRSILVRRDITNRHEAVRNILRSPDTFATSLLVLSVDRFGWEMLKSEDDGQPWSAETIRLEIASEFQVELPTKNLDKIMAAISILTSNEFYKSVSKFIMLCNVLSGDTFDPSVFDPATCSEMAWGITEAMLIEPPDEDEPFSEDIRRYMGAMLDAEGFATAPDVLRLAIRNTTGDPLAAWDDDPELYQAAFEEQQAKTSVVKDMLQSNVLELVSQLESLPLVEGSSSGLVERLQRSLQNM